MTRHADILDAADITRRARHAARPHHQLGADRGDHRLERGIGFDGQRVQGLARDAGEHRRSDVRTVVLASNRFIDHDSDDDTRVGHGRHADEGADVFLDVAATFQLLGRAGLAADAIARHGCPADGILVAR